MSDVASKASQNVPGTKRSGSCSPTGGSTNAEGGETFANFLNLLRRLQAAGLTHRVQQFRDDALAVEVAVPGERWEIEFLEDGEVEIEIFKSSGEIEGAEVLDDVFRRFGD